MTRRTLFRVLGLLATVAAVLLFARSFASAVREATHEAPPAAIGSVLSSLAVLVGTYLVTIAVWRSVITRVGGSLSFGDALKLWSFTNLGRYLPGKIWQIVGIIALGKRHGIDAARGGIVAVVTLGLMIGTGAILGLLTLPTTSGTGHFRFAAILLSLGLVTLIAWPQLLSELARRIPGRWVEDSVRVPSRAHLAFVAAAFLIIWVLQGISFFLLARSWADLSWAELPRLTGAYAVSYVAGLLAVFAPGGIGVRESLLGILLQPLVQQGLPVNLAVVSSRVLSMVAEAIVLAAAIGIHFGARPVKGEPRR